MSPRTWFFALFTLTGFLESGLCILPTTFLPRKNITQNDFQWSSIKPSSDLHYVHCYDGFECARLLVSLDWNNSSNPKNIALAVIRLPATVPEADPSHEGSIILNPGGPGGPGTLDALASAQRIQQKLDGNKRFEITSFDPRGVFYSEPNIFCFNSASEAEIWFRQKRAVGSLNSSDYALKYHWDAEEGRGRVCAESSAGFLDGGENVRGYLSTAYVARDMLEIVRKIEERKAALLSHTGPKESLQAVLGERSAADVKLQYIGVSYGTFLGQTFASMYPENVGRMVLDGNIDGDNWVSRWEASVDDNDAVRQYFFHECFNAQSRCALWRSQDSGPDDIEERYVSISKQLKERPVSVTTDGRTTVITEDELGQGFFTTLYQPLSMFELFAEFLNDLYTGAQPKRPFWQHGAPGTDGGIDVITSHILHNGEVGAAIQCSDGPDPSATDMTGFKEYLDDLVSRSPHAGANQAEWKLPCWTWPKELQTKWRYDGSFNRSVPILFVNNRLDPATPLKDAKKMASRFNESSVLVQDNVGHGALFPAADCVWERVRTYMQNGELPEDGSICEFPCKLFNSSCLEDMSMYVPIMI